MRLLLEIALLGAMIYLFKTSVIAFGKINLSPFVREMVGLLPVAMLASLVTSIAIDASKNVEQTGYIAGLSCVAIAGLITWLRKSINAACIVSMILLIVVEFSLLKAV